MDSHSNDRLVERARAGDHEALVGLFTESRPRLVRMIEMRLDPALRRRLDPADVVQEAWLDVARRFPEWCAAPNVPLPIWLRLVTSQALVTAQRRHLGAHKRDVMREVLAPASRSTVSSASAADLFVASETTPTQAVQREELRARVLAALEDLDPMDREILALRHFEGLSNEEAAAELAIEPAAASKRFVRALVRLRPVLKSLAPPEPGPRS